MNTWEWHMPTDRSSAGSCELTCSRTRLLPRVSSGVPQQRSGSARQLLLNLCVDSAGHTGKRMCWSQ